jgi:hypothetical protein
MEPALEDVTVEAVDVVEELRVAAVEMLHSPGEVRVEGLDEEVVVIRQQAVSAALPAEAATDGTEQVEEGAAIRVRHEHRLPTVPPRGHVVDAVWDLNTWWSGHSSTVGLPVRPLPVRVRFAPLERAS